MCGTTACVDGRVIVDHGTLSVGARNRRAVDRLIRIVLAEKDDEKNNDQKSAATYIHVHLHRDTHPLRGC